MRTLFFMVVLLTMSGANAQPLKDNSTVQPYGNNPSTLRLQEKMRQQQADQQRKLQQDQYNAQQQTLQQQRNTINSQNNTTTSRQ